MSKAVKVVFSDEEYMRVKKRSGYEALASFVRRTVLGSGTVRVGADGKPAPELEVKQTVDPVVPRPLNPEHPEYVGLVRQKKKMKLAEPKPAEAKGEKCPHGTKEGYPCWQCGGIAKVS